MPAIYKVSLGGTYPLPPRTNLGTMENAATVSPAFRMKSLLWIFPDESLPVFIIDSFSIKI
jgi:hypothetical protein